MKNVIETIISEIPRGMAFDNHYIITTVIRFHGDEYLSFIADNVVASSRITEYVHSELAKIIASFESTLIKRLPPRSISYNIRGNASECALWERI
jgi:hypothetical protein